ncbi:hypothetical protein ACHAW6_009812 [Cyclotella cf. meneghiniana]
MTIIQQSQEYYPSLTPSTCYKKSLPPKEYKTFNCDSKTHLTTPQSYTVSNKPKCFANPNPYDSGSMTIGTLPLKPGDALAYTWVKTLSSCIAANGLNVIHSAGLALGVSMHSYSALVAALGVGPRYISLGPIFPTLSKNVKFDPQGLEMVWQWLIPPEILLVGIGGTGDERVAKECGMWEQSVWRC